MPVRTCRVFPLPGVVLFPGMLMPLRIFEPRYLQLLEKALESDRRISMANVRVQDVPALAGDPRLYDVVGEGEIVHCERLADSTFRVVLEGRHRLRLVKELPKEDLVRIFEAQQLSDDPVSSKDLIDLMEILDSRIKTWIQKRLPESVHDSVLSRFSDCDSDGGRLDQMAALVIHVPAHRQALIESTDIYRRARILENLTRWAGSTGPFGLTTMN